MSQRVVKIPEGDPAPEGALQQTGYEDDGHGARFAIYLVDDTTTASSLSGSASSTNVAAGSDSQSNTQVTWHDQQDVA